MKKSFNCVFPTIALAIVLFSTSAIYADEAIDPTPQLQQKVNEYLQTYAPDDQDAISAVSLSVSSPNISNPIIVNSGCVEKTPDITHCSTPADNYHVQANNLYEIGSITKSFIAVILLQIEATPGSNFNINQKLSQYLPIPEGWGTAAGEITVKQLLNMTSGVASFNDSNGDPFWLAFKNNPHYDFTSDQIVAYIQNEYLMFYPGANWYYSNTNYILAGQLVEKLTGHSLQDEINTRIIQPLGLTNTFYVPNDYPDNTFAIDRRMVHGYMECSEFTAFPLGTEATYWSTSGSRGAGAIIASPTDVMLWAHALYTSPTLLQPQQRAELESLVDVKSGQPIVAPTPNDPGYGLGIFSIYGPNGETVYFYNGATLGYIVEYVYFPKEDITISLAVNSFNPDHNFQDMMGLINEVYSILINSVT